MTTQNLDMTKIDFFENHPFSVLDDEDMYALITSIKYNGLIVPINVRPKEDGRYEIISGHRRFRACEMLGYKTIPCFVDEITKDEAIVEMVDSNIQRTKVLPSERAFAYKMRLDAMNRQGIRTDLDSPNETKLNSGSELAELMKESRATIYRYAQLTELIPALLDWLDDGKIRMKTALELSHLDKDLQALVYEKASNADLPVSYSHAVHIRRETENGYIDGERIESILKEPEDPFKDVFKSKRIQERIPKELTPAQAEEYLEKALQAYALYLKKQRNMER